MFVIKGKSSYVINYKIRLFYVKFVFLGLKGDGKESNLHLSCNVAQALSSLTQGQQQTDWHSQVVQINDG